jgi:hypothetical protein
MIIYVFLDLFLDSRPRITHPGKADRNLPILVHRQWVVLTTSHFRWGLIHGISAVCAVSARYYTERPDIYPLAMEIARDAAGRALVEGSKSVDLCQAYLIMAVYPVPKKKWVEDRSWLLMGVAIQ